jgi:hypothetical protein
MKKREMKTEKGENGIRKKICKHIITIRDLKFKNVSTIQYHYNLFQGTQKLVTLI